MSRTKLADHQPHTLSSDDTLVLWRCDEALATDSFVDAGPNARTLVDFGSPPVVPSLFQSSPTAGARSFDGSTQYGQQAVATPADRLHFQWTWAGLGIGAEGGITVEAWIRATDLSTPRYIMALDGPSSEIQANNAQIGFFVDTTGALATTWEHGAGTNADALGDAGAVTVGQVHHVAIVIENDPDAFYLRRIRFYVDGAPAGMVAGLTPPDGGTAAVWTIGRRSASSSFLFQGQIDDVRVSKFAATEACVRASYARGIRDFDEQKLSEIPFGEHHVRVLIQNKFDTIEEAYAEGDWIDMTTAFGWDWVKSVRISPRAESQVASATVELVGHIGELNLSPLALRYVDGALAEAFESPWNNKGGANDNAFLGEMRPIRIEVASVPWGTGRYGAAPFFRPRFDGFVKSVREQDAGDTIVLECLDLGVALQDVMIEPDVNGLDRVYGSSSGTAVEGQLQSVIEDNAPDRYTVLSIDDSGAGGRLEVSLLSTGVGLGQGRPHLLEAGDPFAIESTFNFDGVYTVQSTTEEEITSVETHAAAAAEVNAILLLLPAKGYLGGRPFLWVPTSPGWLVYEWTAPSSQSVMQHLEQIAAQIGWRVAYEWDDHRQTYRLKLGRPSALSNSGIIPIERVLEAPGVDFDALWPRDVVIVDHEEETSTGTIGERTRVLAAATAPDRAAVIGRRVARITVETASNINTSAEGQELADNVLADISSPQGQAEFVVCFDPWTELGDYFMIGGETQIIGTGRGILPRFLTMSTPWGCYGRDDEFRAGAAKTKLTGRASAGATRIERHHELFAQDGRVPGRSTRGPATPSAPGCTGISLGGTVRGVWVTWQFPVNGGNRAFDVMEVHISTTSGFTPSAATLMLASRSENGIVAGLVASTTYRCKLIARDVNGNVSVASAQTTFSTPA